MAKVLIVGAGAAGLMAAGAAVRQGHQVTVLEHTDKPGQKILVTGKGRCNVTNDCTAEEFLHHVRTNPRFLFSSLGVFPPARTMELFESLGVELKVERGRRVFPVSDKAEEIRQALLRYAQDAEIVYDGAKKLLLEELPPEPEAAPAVPENQRHPKKKKSRACPAVCRCAGDFRERIPGRCRAGGHRRCELPYHRLHRRRLPAGPAGRAHPCGAGAQSGQSGQP